MGRVWITVVAGTAVRARACVADVSIPLADGKPGDGLALDEVALHPGLERRRLGRGLHVVPFVVGQLQLLGRICDVDGHDFVPLHEVTVHVVLDPRLFPVRLPDEVLRDPSTEGEGTLLNAESAAKSPIDVPLLSRGRAPDDVGVGRVGGNACAGGDAAVCLFLRRIRRIMLVQRFSHSGCECHYDQHLRHWTADLFRRSRQNGW